MAKQSRKPQVELPKAIQIPDIPIKVTVEIIIKHEYASASLQKNLMIAADAAGGAGNCPDNRFSYSFEKENATVLSLIVEEFEKDNPGDSGEFTTCINDASPQPKIRVIALAKENSPGGRVALSLKFLGKDVFSSPKEFSAAPGGFLKLIESPKVPL